MLFAFVLAHALLASQPGSIRLEGAEVAQLGEEYVFSAIVENGSDRPFYVPAQPLIGAIASGRPILPHDQSRSCGRIWVGSAGKPEASVSGETRRLSRADPNLPLLVRVPPHGSTTLQIRLSSRDVERADRYWIVVKLPGYWTEPMVAKTWPVAGLAPVPVLRFSSEAYQSSLPGLLPAADFEIGSSPLFVESRDATEATLPLSCGFLPLALASSPQAASPPVSPATPSAPICDTSSYDPVWESHFAQRTVLTRVKPAYPQAAAEQGVEGRVVVAIVVDRAGAVVMACATAGPDVLTKPAEMAARQWTFKENFGQAPGGKRRYTVDGVAFDFILAERRVFSRP